VPRFDRNAYVSPEGVTLDTNVDFGDVGGLAYLDPDVELDQLSYFHTLIDLLVKELKYVTGTDLHGAPYDWRMAPDGLGSYFEKLRKLIEKTWSANRNQEVILISHSMGGPILQSFLNSMSVEWKKKHIKVRRDLILT
jgi:lysophospholipase-3